MTSARTARIALLQLPAFSIEEAEVSLAHTLRRIDEAAREKPDLIALPEVTYPAYFLGTGDLSRCNVLSPADAAARIGEKAREHGVYIAAGLALDAPEGGYANGALLFGRDGSIAGRYDKSFLFHFDRKWFSRGNAYPVFETDFGRVGMLVCADGRLPEIARSLAINGAQLILDLTAWVSSGRRPQDLSTIQVEFLMPVRASENGVWIACCDKFGVEAESIVYAGRSRFIDPAGATVAELGPDEEGTLVYDVPLADPAPRVMRRPELYGALAQPTESLPVTRTLDEPFVVSEHDHQVAAVQMAMPPTGGEFLVAARRHVERLAVMDAELVVFPATPSRLRRAYEHDAVLDGMLAIARDTGVCVAFTVSEPDADGWRAMYLVGPKGVLAKHRQSHKPPGPRFETMPLGDEPSPVVHTPVGRVGLMVAAEGWVPEVARSLMLRAAEIILWCADDPGSPMMQVHARARAEENRVYVICAAAPTENGATMLVDATGRQVAQALAGRDLSVAADINRALAHQKRRAPGTDVVRDRQPASYGALTAVRDAAGAVVKSPSSHRSDEATPSPRKRSPYHAPLNPTCRSRRCAHASAATSWTWSYSPRSR
jgi:predicted amidohydrolase